MTTETIKLTKIIAEEGKIFQNKETGDTYGSEMYLGFNDNADNYIEIDAPETEKNNA